MTKPDPRAGKLCTACNAVRLDTSRPHCTSPTCTWWRCAKCGAHNSATGANDKTNRDGTVRDTSSKKGN